MKISDKTIGRSIGVGMLILFYPPVTLIALFFIVTAILAAMEQGWIG